MPLSNLLTATQISLLSFFRRNSSRLHRKVAAVVIAAGSISIAGGASNHSAIAQNVSVTRDSNTGSVQIDRRAFDVETGELSNGSNVPLPADLPEATREGIQLDTGFVDGAQAPNSIDIRTDFDFIEGEFSERLNQRTPEQDLNYTLDRSSLRTTTEFDLNYVQGEHQFGEGIQVTVFDEAGNVRVRETRFVRGDGVTVGPNGEALPESGRIEVEYGVDERVELRILNIRSDNAQPTESGVYFTRDGQIIAEDLPDGGDRDFDDGEYFELEGGSGQANAIEESETIEITTTTDENPLDPQIRQESIVEDEETFTESDTITEKIGEEVIRGEIELPDTQARRLGHAIGARTETGEQLVYDRYSGTVQVRAGSDGIGATGQLRPLNSSPNAAPTLLTGDAVFDPFADDNEAGFGLSVGITQFLSRTHRNATDAFGAPIISPDGSRLLEPTGVFNNRRLVGYVPPRLDESAQGAIESNNGIYDLPSDRGVVIAAPDPQRVGLGNAAYLENVGGLIIEQASGELVFVPQWTEEGYEQDEITLAAGEAVRIIYALVPQQNGQNLRLGQVYEVENSTDGYRIADGGFIVIAADQYPENFYQESNEVYTVEDTLPTINNVSTPTFNGVRGVYLEADRTELLPTVDPDLPAEADARVGTLLSPLGIGQLAYARTTRAGGFYLGGSLTSGIGNQRDTTREIFATTDIETDSRRIVETINTFSAPVTEVTSTDTEVTTTTRRDGIASFEIGEFGRLSQLSFDSENEGEIVTSNRDLGSSTDSVLGEEALIDSVTQTRTETLGTEIIEQDITTNDSSDSFATAAPLRGELALGGVYNFGNTPWTPAANTLRAEIFARDTVIGRTRDGGEVGLRAELTFYPFGERRREGFQYDEAGQLVAMYETEPLMEGGEQVMDTLTGPDGTVVEVPVYQFVLDENGDRIPLRVGTGRSRGPGVYLRVEDAFDDNESVAFDGGLQFTF